MVRILCTDTFVNPDVDTMLSDVGDALVDSVVGVLEMVHGIIGRSRLFTRACFTITVSSNARSAIGV